MIQEEKQLLLKDLVVRLPYGVFIHYHWSREGNTIDEDRELDFSDVETLKYNIENPQNDWCDISWKPYLRRLSSMTEKEFELLKQYSGLEYDQLDLAELPNNHKCLDFYLSEVPSDVVVLVFDWLNAHHFDYRLLIEMGLALEAPEGMYKTE